MSVGHNLPEWASPGNWLGPEGHADLRNPVDDPSLCNLCSFPLKSFKDEAESMSSFNEFHLLTILSEKKCQIHHNTFFYETSESVLLFFLDHVLIVYSSMEHVTWKSPGPMCG